MRHLDTIIIGAGQAGLAMSYHLSRLGLDHVLLERGRVGERWRTGSWESLHLLTPNWMTRFPDFDYRGEDPDGFMTAPAFVGHLQAYADAIAAPVLPGAGVLALEARGLGYRAVTQCGVFEAPTAVIATGACNMPAVPALAGNLPADIMQITPAEYRSPSALPDGGVLVVGASSSGVQLADEIHRSGRPVTVAVGRHTRLPRTYRGRDITWWLDQVGVFDERYDQVPDIAAARRQPSLQLVGSADRRSLGLAELRQAGIRLVGRAVAVDGPTVRFIPDLPETTAAADVKMTRVLDRIDEHIVRNRVARHVGPPDRPPRQSFTHGPDAIDLRAAGIRTVVWATGYRRDYSWLTVPVLDGDGEIRHDGGVVASPGLYVLGLRFMRRRKSSFIDGVGPDAADLSAHIATYLGGASRLAA
jgi:putative flavoprotein involved in K+ transport